MGKLEKLLNSVDKFNENGRFADALNQLKKAVKIAPENSDVYLSFALTYDLMDQTESALKFFHKALEISPNDTDVLTSLGITLSRSNRLNEAIEVFEQALSIKPELPIAKWHLALTYKFMGLYENSLEFLLELKENIDEYDFIKEEIHYHLGQCYFDMGWIENSLAEFKKQIEISPEDTWAHLSIGNCYFDLGWLEESITCFKNIIRTNPSFIPGYNALAFSYAEKGWYNEALEVLRDAEKIAPEDESIKENIDYINSLIDEDGNKLLFLFNFLLKIYKEKTKTLSPKE